MDQYQSLNHTKWECKYHIVWIPKYRKKKIYTELRKMLGEVFRGLAGHRESKILEGHLMVDHIHMLIEIPPKYSVARVVVASHIILTIFRRVSCLAQSTDFPARVCSMA